MKYVVLAALLGLILRGMESKAQAKVFSSDNFEASELKTNVLLPLEKDFELSFTLVYPEESDKGSFNLAFLNPMQLWSKFPKPNETKFPIAIFEIDNLTDKINKDAEYVHADFFDSFTSTHRNLGDLPVINLKPPGTANEVVLSWKKCDEQIKLYVNGELKISGKQNLKAFLDTENALLIFWTQAGKALFNITLSKLNLRVAEPVKPEVNLGPDFYFTGAPVRLDAGENFSNYAWSTGTKSRYAAATKAGSYSVIAYTGNGCESSDTVVLHLPGSPNADKLITDSGRPKKTISNKSKATAINLTGSEPEIVKKPIVAVNMPVEKIDSVLPNNEILSEAVKVLDHIFRKSVTDSIHAVSLKTNAYVLGNVNFTRGSSKLLPESAEELNKLAAFLKNYTNFNIRINGHTDTAGDPDLNMELSENRANSVRYYLFEQGIPFSRIETKGFGSTKPLGTYAGGSGKNPNMRVEFEIFE
ncbi:MAG TPA: hypothetical protein DCQ31_10005 [Bacteroidales bacterium]|nr:hypothetical protein [Bacteroidales bacterium]